MRESSVPPANSWSSLGHDEQPQRNSRRAKKVAVCVLLFLLAAFALSVAFGVRRGYASATWAWLFCIYGTLFLCQSPASTVHILARVTLCAGSITSFICYCVLLSSEGSDQRGSLMFLVFLLLVALGSMAVLVGSKSISKAMRGFWHSKEPLSLPADCLSPMPADYPADYMSLQQPEPQLLGGGGREHGGEEARRRGGAARCCESCCWLLLLVLSVLATTDAVALTVNFLHFRPAAADVHMMADGHLMHAHCTGAGSPTVVLEHGWGGSYLDWSWVQSLLTPVTRVCSYDHSGYAWSQLTDGRARTTAHIAEELRELLPKIGVKDDFVFAGHSFAGFNMRYFVNQNPGRVKGMVMVDCVNPNSTENCEPDQHNPPSQVWPFELGRSLAPFGLPRLFAWLGVMPKGGSALIAQMPAHLQAQYTDNVLKEKYYLTRVNEWVNWPSSCASVESIHNKTLDFPLVVLHAELGIHKGHEEYARQLQALSPNSSFVLLKGSQHSAAIMNETYATTVAQQIVRVVNEVRSSQSVEAAKPAQ